MKIKIYSKQEPKNLKDLNALTVERYTVENCKKLDSQWLSEIATEDYTATKLTLEEAGYTAHPANSNEIETEKYSIFR
jgi:hypothetical protein